MKLYIYIYIYIYILLSFVVLPNNALLSTFNQLYVQIIIIIYTHVIIYIYIYIGNIC